MYFTEFFILAQRLDNATLFLIFNELDLCRSIATFGLQCLPSLLINTFKEAFCLHSHVLPNRISIFLNIGFFVSIGNFYWNVRLKHLQLKFFQLNVLIGQGRMILFRNGCFWLIFQLVSLLIIQLSLDRQLTKFIQHVLFLLERQFVCSDSILVLNWLMDKSLSYAIWHSHRSSHLRGDYSYFFQNVFKRMFKAFQLSWIFISIYTFLLDLSSLSVKIMYKNMLKALLLFLTFTSLFCEEIVTNNLSYVAEIHQGLNSETPLTTEGDSILSNPLVITIIVLVSLNIFVFILVYGCRRCFRLPYQVNQAVTRENAGAKYPNIKFETHSYCLVQEESFRGRDCYQRGEVINSLPAFIYGRQIDAEISHLDYFTIRQCQKCGGLTRTLEIFKYGKLRECWETLFMIVISPCFLAFTIHRITANSILWRKFFCTECGFEKRVRQ